MPTDAGLFLPVALAHHLGLGKLVDRHVDLGQSPGRANAGDTMLGLVASASAAGDCIDDAYALRSGSAKPPTAGWAFNFSGASLTSRPRAHFFLFFVGLRCTLRPLLADRHKVSTHHQATATGRT